MQVLLLELGPPEVFLNSCPEPPSSSHIHTAITLLHQMKAITTTTTTTTATATATPTITTTANTEKVRIMTLTPLGYHLARLPMDVKIAKTLIYACILDCIEPILTIAAAMGGKSIYYIPPSKVEEAFLMHLKYSKRFQSASYLIQLYNKEQQQQQQKEQLVNYNMRTNNNTGKLHNDYNSINDTNTYTSINNNTLYIPYTIVAAAAQEGYNEDEEPIMTMHELSLL